MVERGYGLNASRLTGSEVVYTCTSSERMMSYDYEAFMGRTKDQGMSMQCVAYSISAVVEWFWRSCGTSGVFDIGGLYNSRQDKRQGGMSFLEALDNMSVGGSFSGGVQLGGYVMLQTRDQMEDFLVGTGPFIFGLPVRSPGSMIFWQGGSLSGYHAVCCCGYTPEGLRLLNSWGSSYGEGGYATLSWDDIGLILEAWGLLIV